MLLGLAALAAQGGSGRRQAAGNEFLMLPDYAQNQPVSLHAVSADGQAVVGSSASLAGLAIRWTKAEGYRELGDLREPATRSDSTAVSADGRIIVGSGSNELLDREGFRWTNESGMVSIGTLAASAPGAFHPLESLGVSDSGDVIVGYVSKDDGLKEAFRWTASDGMESLGDLMVGYQGSAALDVTGDGAKVVGWADDNEGRQAFYWTREAGTVPLGNFDGVSLATAAEAITSDGSVIVGQASSANGVEAFRWSSEAGLVGLGHLGGGAVSRALGVSGDGKVVVGNSDTRDDSGARLGFIWDEIRGMRDLVQVLTNDYGLTELHDLNALGLGALEVRAISDDGLTIIGPNWVADLHGDFLPGDTNFDGAVDLADFGTLKANFGTGQYRNQGDFSADGRVDLADFGLLKQNFGATTAVPEPSAWILAVLAAAATCGLRRRAPGP